MTTPEVPATPSAEPLVPAAAPAAGVFPLAAPWAFGAAFVSGLLYWLAFPGVDAWPLAFVLMTPFAGQAPGSGPGPRLDRLRSPRPGAIGSGAVRSPS